VGARERCLAHAAGPLGAPLKPAVRVVALLSAVAAASFRRLYHRLTPGARAKQDTYIGHYWLLATPDGVCLGIFKAAPQSLAFF
jgi:hypothetical protein